MRFSYLTCRIYKVPTLNALPGATTWHAKFNKSRNTCKVGKGGGTENGPAILPIANSFEIFCLVSSGMSATLFKIFEVIGDLGPE